MNNIKQLYDVVYHNVATINGTMDYERVTDAIIALANEVHNTDTEIDWYIGEGNEFSLDDLIVGAYWHFTEWHGGQWSKGYAALCALGEVFSPNMSTLNEDRPEYYAYDLLNDMAIKSLPQIDFTKCPTEKDIDDFLDKHGCAE
jgi:hypothetical protein